MAAAGVQDLGEWIGAGSHSLFNFPPGVRPVPLEIHIQGFDIVNFDSRLQAMARPTYASLVAAGNEARPLLLSAQPALDAAERLRRSAMQAVFPKLSAGRIRLAFCSRPSVSCNYPCAQKSLCCVNVQHWSGQCAAGLGDG